MSFNIFYGNKLQNLLSENLIYTLKNQPLSDPLQKEIIIVQNQGMSIWLKQFIARKTDICSNIDFPFINGFINQVLEECLDNPPEKDYFHPHVMTWKIWQLLKDNQAQHEDLQGYLQRDNNGVKHYQLASRIAQCFDAYQIYRSDEILENLSSLSRYTWQKEIWQKISDGRVNRAQAFDNFRKIAESKYLNELERIFIVGIFSMPPIFVEFFYHLSEFIDVNIYFTFPSDLTISEYQYSGKFTNLKNLSTGTSNSLLETLGKAGEEFFHLLRFAGGKFHAQFLQNSEDSLLLIFQNSLQNPVISERENPPEITPSIQLHNCHSKMREVEVLRNNILYLLNNDDLNPADILVMMPNISDYSPYIKAVFERKDISGPPADFNIPYTITDNSISFETTIDQVFLKLLGMHKTRFEATIIMELLEREAIYKKLQLTAEDIELCRKWISETNIRWGINGEQREQEFGLINFDENSWEKGFNRMFLGYCLKDDDYPKLHYSHLPYDMFEGRNNFVLGKLSHFMNLLVELRQDFKEKDSIENWQKKLLQLLTDFFYDVDEFQKDINLLRQKILKLSKDAQLGEVKGKISIEILQDYFSENLSDEFQTSRYFRGGITFSTLQPIRNIPAKVICILGMNDNEFPRNEHFNAFNILGNERRCGDRIKREEDQYLFFEALMAAEKYLIISYIGQDIKSNDVSEPASTVCELRDYLKKLFGDSVMNKIYFRHKLQSHNSLYFAENSKLFSYSSEDFDCLQKVAVRRFYQNSLQNTPEITDIYIDNLIRTLSNPSQFFVEEILGAKIKKWEIEISDTEKFDLDNLERYSVNQFIQQQLVRGSTEDFIYDILKARDDVPVGLSGQQLFAAYYEAIDLFLKLEIEELDNTLLKCLQESEASDIDFDFNGIRIHGRLPAVYKDNMIYTRYAKFTGKDGLKSWIYHLIGRICGKCATTFAITKDKIYRFPEILSSQAKTELAKIINLYQESYKKPLSFFPNTSFAFITKKPTKSKSKIDEAKTRWAGGFNSIGEKENEYFRLFFSEKVIETTEFEEISKILLKPFAKHFDDENPYLAEEVKL